MAQREFVYKNPRRVVAGTVGQPGERVFYIQAEQDSAVTSVELEKQQVAALAEHLDEILDTLPGSSDVTPAQPDTGPLSMPLESDFRVTSITFGWESGTSRLVLELRGASAGGTEEDSSLTVHLTMEQARSFIQRSQLVVAAGRRACPLCEQPINPTGHICPRANGYHRHALTD